MSTSMRSVFGIILIGLMLATLVSCPEPIIQEVVYEVEDEIAPVITVTSPQGNSPYYSTVQVDGYILMIR